MLFQLISFLKKHKERATLIGLGLGLAFFIGSGIYLQKKKSQDKDPPRVGEATKIEIQVAEKATANDSTSPQQKTRSFFIRPSPSELLEQLSAMEDLQEDVAQSRFAALPVLWEVYFFSVEQLEGGETVLLDIAEDGFGIQVQGTIRSDEYPHLRDVKRGEKVWVAGKIIAVDPSGTGTVYLDIELLDFSPDGPPAARLEPSAASRN